MLRFLKLGTLNNANITIEKATKYFTLSEILRYGGYNPMEISKFSTTEEINNAHKYNYNNKSKFDRNKDNFR